jgi:membrane protease YdiL (CAAX protease family)
VEPQSPVAGAPLPRRSGRLSLPTGAAFPARAGWWIVAGFLGAYLLGSVGASIGIAAFGSQTAAGTTALGELGLWSGFFATALFVSRHYGTGALSRDYGLRFRPSDLLWGLGAALGGLLVAAGVEAALAHTRFSGTNDQLLTQQSGKTVGTVVVTVVVALGAPFFEELFFRGFVRTVLQTRFGTHGAVWLQAVLFGLAHVNPSAGWGNATVVAAIAGFGVLLGYTALLSGRLAGGMIAHSLFNLYAVVGFLAN